MLLDTFALVARLARDDARQLAQVAHLCQRVRRFQRAAGLFDGAGEFDVHQTIEAQIAQARIERDLCARPIGDRRHDVEQPIRVRVFRCAFFRESRARQSAHALFEHLHRGDDLAPFDLARGRARQFAVPKMQHLDALEEGQCRRDIFEMLLDLVLDFGTRERDVVIVIGHDHARDLLAQRAVGQTDDAQLFDVRRIRVEFFDLVWIDVLAVRINDDVFGAPDKVEVAVVVEAAEVARVEPAIDEDGARGLLVIVITEHHVCAARDDLANARLVRVHDLHFNAGHCAPHARRVQLVRGPRHGQHGRCFRQPIAFEDREAEAVKISLDLFIQGRAATDQVAYAPAETCVDRAEDDLTEIERRVIAQPTVGRHQRVRDLSDPLAALAQTIHDAPVQQFPQRWHANHAGDVSVLDRTCEFFAGQLRQICDLRAAT